MRHGAQGKASSIQRARAHRRADGANEAIVAEAILVTAGPTFEKIVALALWLEAKGVSEDDVQFLFEDLDRDPGADVEDIDVRVKYPRGSSSAEVMAKKLGVAAGLEELLTELNGNNADGRLKGGE